MSKGQMDLFADYDHRDDEGLKRELERINQQRKYHPIEVRQILGCSLSMVYRLYGSGQLRGLRIGASIRIFGWSVARYILDNAN